MKPAPILIIAALLFVPAAAAPAQTPDAIRERLERAGAHDAAAAAIRSVYAGRAYRPIWFAEARLAPRGEALLAAFAAAHEHGLAPTLYGMPALASRVRAAVGEARADAELALTRAFLDYATDLVSGAIDDPRRVGRQHRDARRPDPARILAGIAEAADPSGYLQALPPDRRRYDQLKVALAGYRAIELSGGWPYTVAGPRLRPGVRGPRVATVKRRLRASGDLDALGDPEAYDQALAGAVTRFQVRHGLAATGIVGPETVAEMNVPVRTRIEQIVINLERRRWLAPFLGERYIYLNIADNELKLVEGGRTVHVARVIVGKPYQQTPSFSATMTQIEINPYWNVPRSILVNELVPIIRRNPGYLAANDFEVLARRADGLPVAIRQRPGPGNALGALVFRFPNPHNVYLHDTPAKHLFAREQRFFSHGCMRVQDPMRLALMLLGGQEGDRWTTARIGAIIATRAFTAIPLERRIAVHVTYLTAWAERDGTVHFRRDVYRRDAAVKTAMARLARVR
jgi:murein L,D-transpeptidase YcbB/YkuD